MKSVSEEKRAKARIRNQNHSFRKAPKATKKNQEKVRKGECCNLRIIPTTAGEASWREAGKLRVGWERESKVEGKNKREYILLSASEGGR